MPTISTARGRIRIRIAKWTLGGRWDCIMRKRKKNLWTTLPGLLRFILEGEGVQEKPNKHVSVGTEHCHAGPVSFNQQKTARAWPRKAGGGAFPPPCRSCSPGSSRPSPTTTPPNSPLDFPTPNHQSSCKGKQREGPRQPPRRGRAGAEPGAAEAALRAWEDSRGWLGQSRPPYSTGTCCRALQRRSTHRRPPVPVLRGAPPVAPCGPREPRPVPSQSALFYPLGARPFP